MAWSLDYLTGVNKRFENLLKEKSSLFYLKCLKILPDIIRIITAKLNVIFKRKYLSITLSRIVSPKNVDFLRDNNMGLDWAVAHYSKYKIPFPKGEKFMHYIVGS